MRCQTCKAAEPARMVQSGPRVLLEHAPITTLLFHLLRIPHTPSPLLQASPRHCNGLPWAPQEVDEQHIYTKRHLHSAIEYATVCDVVRQTLRFEESYLVLRPELMPKSALPALLWHLSDLSVCGAVRISASVALDSSACAPHVALPLQKHSISVGG